MNRGAFYKKALQRENPSRMMARPEGLLLSLGVRIGAQQVDPRRKAAKKP
jgi:hypothetical protein